MNIIRFISRRYLFSKKHVSLISGLTAISIAGVTLGTALLIVVLSVFNGFFEVIRGYLLSFDPDIRVELIDNPVMNYDEGLLTEINQHPEIVNLAPYVEGKVMISFQNNRNEVVVVRGIQEDTHIRLDKLIESVHIGEFDLSVNSGMPGVVMSESLLNRYRISPGDEIAMLSTTGMRRALTQFSAPRVNRFEVRGSYNIQQIIDGDIVYVGITAAQRLFNMRNEITGFDIELTDTDKAEAVKADLQEILGDDYRIQTWYDLQKPLYDVMYIEKWGSYFILMIIVVVAVLNIVGSLTMIVIQKRRDIGILLSMGMTPGKIKNIFRSQGIQIGLIGCGIGGTVGILLSLAQKQYGLIQLSSSFIIDAYPVAINPLDIFIVLAGSMLLCFMASWYPAARAASTDPADAVRDE